MRQGCKSLAIICRGDLEEKAPFTFNTLSRWGGKLSGKNNMKMMLEVGGKWSILSSWYQYQYLYQYPNHGQYWYQYQHENVDVDGKWSMLGKREWDQTWWPVHTSSLGQASHQGLNINNDLEDDDLLQGSHFYDFSALNIVMQQYRSFGLFYSGHNIVTTLTQTKSKSCNQLNQTNATQCSPHSSTQLMQHAEAYPYPQMSLLSRMKVFSPVCKMSEQCINGGRLGWTGTTSTADQFPSPPHLFL